MKPQRIYLVTLIALSALAVADCCAYLWLALTSPLASEAYANGVTFQFLAWFFFRGVVWLLVLFCVLLFELIVFGRRNSGHAPAPNSTLNRTVSGGRPSAPARHGRLA